MLGLNEWQEAALFHEYQLAFWFLIVKLLILLLLYNSHFRHFYLWLTVLSFRRQWVDLILWWHFLFCPVSWFFKTICLESIGMLLWGPCTPFSPLMAGEFQNTFHVLSVVIKSTIINFTFWLMVFYSFKYYPLWLFMTNVNKTRQAIAIKCVINRMKGKLWPWDFIILLKVRIFSVLITCFF